MKKYFYLLLLLLPLNLTAQDKENEIHLLKNNFNNITVPFQLIENLIVIDNVVVNQKKGKVVFDTGNQSYFAANAEFFIEEIMEKNVYNKTDTAQGITGNMPTVYSIVVDSVMIGDFCFSAMDGVSFNMKPIRMALGKDFLGFIGYGIMKEVECAIDYKNKLLHLSRLDAEGNPVEKPLYNKKELFSFTSEKGSPIAQLYFGGKTLDFFLDTGAPKNSIDSGAVIGIDSNYLKFTGITDAVTGGDGGYMITNDAVMKQLSIKDDVFTNMPTNVYKFFNKSVSNATLGYPFFSQKIFVFNFKKNKIYITE